MYGRGLALLEAGLVDLGRNQMRGLGLDLLQDRLLHDLGQVRSNNNRPDLIQSTWSLGECFLQWY